MTVDMKGITKEFGPVEVLHSVDFSVLPSEIHGLLGENGAGKTTLMNILAGSFPPTKGKVFLDGKQIEMTNPYKAAMCGIRFIHQELNLCNDLKVFENLFLNEELISKNRMLDKKAMIKRTEETFKRMTINIDPIVEVRRLDSAQKQLVEIARALIFKSELIIMDEPTTALGQHDIDTLFGLMRQLKSEGVSFIYISHKMPELFQICDRYTVLRDGNYITTGYFKDINEKEITTLLIGKELIDADIKADANTIMPDQTVLEVSGLSGKGFKDISFSLRRGEVIAVAGLQGSGTAELADALFNVIPHGSGSAAIHGQDIKGTIQSVMKKGIAMVPRTRKERGILNDLSIRDNLSMAFFNARHKKAFISFQEEKSRYQKNKQKLNIKSDTDKNPITSLSGGNQQKVILGRWLEIEGDVYLLDSPTQGIDVGAKFEIYKLILAMAKEGKGILVFTSEYPEIWKIADSCIVLYRGSINARLERSEMSEEKIMYYSTGANLEV
jgi:ribose transport system ATP-binding protein